MKWRSKKWSRNWKINGNKRNNIKERNYKEFTWVNVIIFKISYSPSSLMTCHLRKPALIILNSANFCRCAIWRCLMKRSALRMKTEKPNWECIWWLRNEELIQRDCLVSKVSAINQCLALWSPTHVNPNFCRWRMCHTISQFICLPMRATVALQMYFLSKLSSSNICSTSSKTPNTTTELSLRLLLTRACWSRCPVHHRLRKFLRF